MDFRDANADTTDSSTVTRYQPLGSINGSEAAELSPSGVLDIVSTDAFRQNFTRLLDSGVVLFFVNLGDVEYIDSTGLGSLMQLYREAKGRGGAARFYNLAPTVREIFTLTHLDKVIKVDQSREAAFSEAEGA